MKFPATTPCKSLRLIAIAFISLGAALNAQVTNPVPAVRGDQSIAAEPAGEDSGTGKPAKLDCIWLPFPDGAKFKVLGLWWFEQNKPKLWRMPAVQFDSLPKGVTGRARSPSGGRILLKCNSSKLGLKVWPLNKGGLKGFDVYVNGSFLRSAVAEEPKVETEVVLFQDLDRREKEIVIYLPCQQEVLVRAVGVDVDTKFSNPSHQFARPLPIVFYGSSVCQGNGALKPGMTYPARLCRDLNLDFVNLGFGGAGKAETNVVDLVNSVPACAYVFDLGKSYGMQDGAAYLRMLQTVRKSHPGTPIFCLTPITSSREIHSQDYSERSQHTRGVMRDAANEFIKSGEKDVYLIEGPDLLGFGEHDGLSKDGVHPTDHGYSIIARKLLPTARKGLGL